MTLKLNGSSSGSVSIDAPASTTGGADITFALPVADGSSGQALTTNASGALSFATVGQPITSGTYTSVGTSTHVDITVDSTDVVKYDIMFANVSSAGGTDWMFQIGDSGGIETSGYSNAAMYFSNSSYGSTSFRSDSWRWRSTSDATFVMDGRFTLTRINGNIWYGDGILNRNETGDGTLYTMCGKKELSGALTTIQISASSDDSQNFDNGHFKLITYK